MHAGVWQSSMGGLSLVTVLHIRYRHGTVDIWQGRVTRVTTEGGVLHTYNVSTFPGDNSLHFPAEERRKGSVSFICTCTNKLYKHTKREKYMKQVT